MELNLKNAIDHGAHLHIKVGAATCRDGLPNPISVFELTFGRQIQMVLHSCRLMDEGRGHG